MKNIIKIRNAEISDAESINRIYNQAIVLGTATADINKLNILHHKEWMQKQIEDDNPVLIAECDGKVAGYNSLTYYRFGRPALLHVRETSYYIDKDYWDRGIASKLMDSIFELSPGIGISTLISIIIDGNTSSIKLINKFGFELWGRLPKIVFFSHGKYDHLIYGKNLE